MAMRTDFVFSQASMQDYLDCKRRFYYQYVERLSWPAIEAEPILENEERMIRGAHFHQMVQQYFLGLPDGMLANAAEAAGVTRWWENFVAFKPIERGQMVYTEKKLNMGLGNNLLVAKFDLLTKQEDGGIQIYDWKTSKKRPKREFVADRMQTRVYPLVVSKMAEKLFPGVKIAPEQIEMVYWYAGYPDTPEVFPYSEKQRALDEAYLLEKITEINSLDGRDDFPKTDDVKRCQFCVYRSLCDRGAQAGNFEQYDPEFEGFGGGEVLINLDEIDEIEI